jgi:threonyl-tRNA synthetase
MAKMLRLRLPDGSTKEVAEDSRPRDVAESIGKRLAQAAIAAKVNGQVVDLDRALSTIPGLTADGTEIPFEILTEKNRDSLDVVRHSSAHVMARAVMRLFPGVQLAFGPATDSGFYYDIDVTPPIKEEDFPKIEEEMRRIIKEAEPFERFERPTSEARALCHDLAQSYKVEHIDDELKQFPTLSFYRQGEFIDLCRGPHLPNAGKIGAFKLLSIAGAYWKNNSNRKQLQRLYATAFFNQKDLDAYLNQVEEAKKRDHRVLGKQLKLFTISPDMAGSGLILWMPKGATVRGILEAFIKEELLKRGYQPVYSPHIGRLKMYETSGHYPLYKDAQFAPMWLNPYAPEVKGHWEFLGHCKAANVTPLPQQEKAFIEDVASKIEHFPSQPYEQAGDLDSKRQILWQWLEGQESYLLKPMNCPHHIQIYKAEPRSYRDLPVRLAEFGTVYRFEQTGELSGMTRVRGFTQDDAHLFVTPEQVETELVSNLDLVFFILKTLGLTDYRVRIGLHDPDSPKYVGSDADWPTAESTLIRVVKSLGMNYSAEKGEAAFYGPKIDFMVNDCIGREWQLGTVQVDYTLPKRFDLEYVGADNRTHRPVMIHRAPFGSMERFVGILIEHFAGAFPLWLAPEQVRVVTISEKAAEYGRSVEKAFRDKGFRASGDYRAEKIGHKVREAQLDKVPYMLVVGEKEQAAGMVAVRDRVDGDRGAKPVAQVIEELAKEVAEKRIRQVSSGTAGLADSGAKYQD